MKILSSALLTLSIGLSALANAGSFPPISTPWVDDGFCQGEFLAGSFIVTGNKAFSAEDADVAEKIELLEEKGLNVRLERLLDYGTAFMVPASYNSMATWDQDKEEVYELFREINADENWRISCNYISHISPSIGVRN